ncbi:zinc-dependent metalloprotease [Dermatophilus congolensis]|uniref:Uncharacterized conserved protein n=1 Tax=Dermatophilus congolensis TaxID=1863 RepID=A0A239VB67_9MICO|nr:zinc-dependent metalloprotease [Dermatophilus congolensis]MBO3130675.1 zinc-dependent metalloprotease [Dermatophilus congolensis]MBO3130695.1 zinc-dependent metalloprotease [Dermatophilus congolensis]MBO3135148.1 zinc-dependent metalloprotease [Dermatophilus congolensis]MBO3137387.1 zinc-dependent metalloprotease [Dermatophilus congolensis]MBO3139628.1 zinc-dependent metalloprotease [Dermatophilus congolensis]
MIDWKLAANTARTLTPPGPRVPLTEAKDAVAALRSSATRAHTLVADTARLHTDNEGPDALIIDRGTWIEANINSLAELLDPALDTFTSHNGRRAMSPWARSVSGKAAGTEMGGILAVLATRVLGQYITAYGQPPEAARLLLVAPNVVATEKRLHLNPNDFRLWVCLHEETHRVQFTAIPWLRDHMHNEQTILVDKLTTAAGGPLELVKALATRLPEATHEITQNGPVGIINLVLDLDTRERLDRLNALMTLLEGHADVVMDNVGPRHIPTVTTIRARFDDRRTPTNPIDFLLRRLLGIETKTAQYRDGAAFVRHIHERIGIDGFNTIWTSPETLPTPTEIHNPDIWIARVQP